MYNMQHREVDTTLHRSTAGICAVCGCRGLEGVQLERALEKQAETEEAESRGRQWEEPKESRSMHGFQHFRSLPFKNSNQIAPPTPSAKRTVWLKS